MIVRDEAGNIARCLESVLPFISHWAIVDTGSKDATPEIVRATLRNLPGKLVYTAWRRDFSLHRNQSVALARLVAGENGLRLLFVDADEQLIVADASKFRRALNERASFAWWAIDGDWHFRKLGVVALEEFDGWRGVIHETVRLKNPRTSPRRVQRFAHVIYGHDGFRRRDKFTVASDTRLLKTAIALDPMSFRDNYFLARTLEASHEFAAAALQFRTAVDSRDATVEDRWQSLWGLGRVLMSLDTTEACKTFVRAHQLMPKRAEPLVRLAEVARLQGQHAQALTLAVAALECPEPNATSMYDRSAYGWRATDEICLAGLSLGDGVAMQHAVNSYTDILCRNTLPQTERGRVLTNLQALLEGL